MQAVLEYLRLGVRGLLLDVEVYRQQRDAPDALQRGAMLVLLISLLVALAALVGSVFESLTTPPAEQIEQTLYQGLTEMPWYQEAAEASPEFEAEFRQQFDQLAEAVTTIQGNVSSSALDLLLLPLTSLLGWLIYGAFAHLVARMLGGTGTLNQTLGCTALASGANLLGLVQLIPFAGVTPFAGVSGVTLLTLIGSYIAVREAHALQPGRAFWATVLGPLLLLVVFVGVVCMLAVAAPDAL
jgi:hypothetical protein